MRWFLLNTLLTAVIVAVAARLSKDESRLGGFIVALPLSTMMVLLLSRAEHAGTADPSKIARSIFVGVPISLVFLVPFVLPERWRPPFWTCYALGVVGLAVGYFVHRAVVTRLG